MSYSVSPRFLQEVEAHAQSQGSCNFKSRPARRTFSSNRLNAKGSSSSSKSINDCITSRTQTSDLRSQPIATRSPRGVIARARSTAAEDSKMDLPTSELGLTRWNELSGEVEEKKWWEVEVEQLYETVWAASGSEHSDR